MQSRLPHVSKERDRFVHCRLLPGMNNRFVYSLSNAVLSVNAKGNTCELQVPRVDFKV